MNTSMNLFIFLLETGWVNAAFVIGSVAIILAIIGHIRDKELSRPRSILLGLFGAALIFVSISGFLVQQVEEPIPTPPPGQKPTIQLTPDGKALPNTEVMLQPIREHFPVYVGEGFLAEGTFSDGMAPYTEDWLWANNRFDIQVINPHTYPDGCDVARYNTDLVWLGGSPGMQFTINGQVVGTYKIAPNSHGYIFHGSISMGDTLCAVGFTPAGYHIILGPDIYYHYDSYCFRDNC
jgi:hypothetical protein